MKLAKINKLYYYTKKEKKLNCYSVYITKSDLDKANLNENDELDIIIGKNEILLKKVKNGVKNEKTNE